MASGQLDKILVCSIPVLYWLLPVVPVWAEEYESIPVINAAGFLPGDLLHSEHHRVESMDISGGFFQFQVDSEFGFYQVTSLALLRTRVQEIKTLAQAINQFETEDDQFSAILRSQLHVSGESAVEIITSPFGTATQLAGQMANNLGDTLAGVDILAEQEGFRYENTEPADAIAATHKRNIASQHGLDVYSTNEDVQAFLNTVTKARTSGKISAGVALVRNQNTAGARIANKELDRLVNLKLKNNPVSELAAINDQILGRMVVGQDLRGRFLHHTMYSPRHQTVIAAYLDYLAGVSNRAAFVNAALSAGNEAEALSCEQLVRMLVLYHDQFNPLYNLHVLQGVTGAITGDGKIIFFLADDILYWSEATSNKYHALADNARAAGFSEPELVTSGTITPVARRNLEDTGFVLHEDFFSMAGR
ncbi:MAG: hypothetical protein A2W28_09560 [Gammaproteobacteria bacterium RBG_16_51_14]|nr:MAG: hypothetical protein A2W28_09560 [Gammaproteobacteria bacterium RBG_16_51_14]